MSINRSQERFVHIGVIAEIEGRDEVFKTIRAYMYMQGIQFTTNKWDYLIRSDQVLK